MWRLVTVALFVIGGLVAGGLVDWMTWQAWGLFGVASLLFEPVFVRLMGAGRGATTQ